MNINFSKTALKETLKSWVNFETPTGDEKRLMGFSSLVVYALEKTGAKVQTCALPRGPVLHATFGTGKKRCVLMGHMDTVFSYGEAERYDEENGRLYGAGVLDMKSGLVMLVNAFECLSNNLPDGWQIEALINSDEEWGSVDSRETLLSVLKGAELVFSFEGNKENCLTVSRKGIWTFEIVSKGIAAHTSGGADKNKNAIYRLSNAISAIYDCEYKTDVTLNIGMIEGGKATNVVADRAKLRGEIRAETDDGLKEAEEKIIRISEENGCAYLRLTNRPPMKPNDKTMRLFHAFSKIDPTLIPRAAGGGGDAAFAVEAGAYAIDGLGAEGARAHTRREYVIEESLEKRFLLAVNGIMKCMREFEEWT
ncbi:MAG: M20 family metallopeptidase [Clostridiales bacterium]|nr:M20 family metallopeptidase [Clostridiales bacterium]